MFIVCSCASLFIFLLTRIHHDAQVASVDLVKDVLCSLYWLILIYTQVELVRVIIYGVFILYYMIYHDCLG